MPAIEQSVGDEKINKEDGVSALWSFQTKTVNFSVISQVQGSVGTHQRVPVSDRNRSATCSRKPKEVI